MKKIFFILTCLVMCAQIGAQTYFWKDGQIELAQTNCVIRFDKVPAENFSSITGLEQMNNSLYMMFGQDKSFRNRLACGYQGYNTDIEYNSRSENYQGIWVYNPDINDGNLSAATGKDPWNYLAKLVYNATLIIDGIAQYSDTTNATCAFYLGEALFLRAFALSEMVKLWGDVPILWKIYRQTLIPAHAKQDRNTAYELMRSDLRRAANLLPWANLVPNMDRSVGIYQEPTSDIISQEMYMEHPNGIRNYTGVPTKAAALGLLARIDLNYAGFALRPNNLGVPSDGFAVQLNVADSEKRRELYKEALEACAQVINQEGSFKLLPDYEQVFKNICADVTDYQQSEVIWEIPFADGTRGQFMNYNSIKCNANTQNALKNNATSTSNANARIVPTLYFEYEDGDSRRDVTVVPFEWRYEQRNSSVTTDDEYAQVIFPQTTGGESVLYQRVIRAHAWSLGKYRVEWMSRERNGNDDGVNYPVLRYADVVLMFCEAALGGITGDVPVNTTGLSAQTLFDQIRNRANLGSKTLTMPHLQAERKFEFAGEYLRKYDLIRWGLLRSALVNARTQLNQLSQHTGAFANTSDTLYYKYSYAGDQYSYTDNIKGYVLEDVSFTRPANFNKNNGWCKTNVFKSNDEPVLDPSAYTLYDYEHPEYLDSHQLWPIFSLDLVNAPEGLLWNDYNY